MQPVNPALTTTDEGLFRQTVYDYYRANARAMPWRETHDAYAILVSEIMLQQTQVDRVRDKYREFLAAFPGINELAHAELSQVLALWQGLGYNRRAVSLRLCAIAVMERHGGVLPREIEALQALPGIGPYTARAIAAFAFGTPTPFIETNIRAVFIHHFFADRHGVLDGEILPLVERTLDREQPREWYYALMDYGAMLKRNGVNPSRRSAHHVSQSPFRGSNREQRGRILKMILASPGMTENELVEAVAGDAKAVARNVEQLAKEGFIRQQAGRLWIGVTSSRRD